MGDHLEPANFDFAEPLAEDVLLQDLDYTVPSTAKSNNDPLDAWALTDSPNGPDAQASTHAPWELMDLGGLYETPPPMEMMEEL